MSSDHSMLVWARAIRRQHHLGAHGLLPIDFFVFILKKKQ
jgi:hypothetical protein